MKVKGRVGKGEQRGPWIGKDMKVIRKDMKEYGILLDMAQDRKEWAKVVSKHRPHTDGIRPWKKMKN